MNTGEILGVMLVGFMLIWGACDYFLWRADKQTFSQWVIRESKKRIAFTLFILAVILGLAIWLLVHFETIQILLGYFKNGR